MFSITHPHVAASLASPSLLFPPAELCELHQLQKSSLWKGHHAWGQLPSTVLLSPTQQGHLDVTL